MSGRPAADVALQRAQERGVGLLAPPPLAAPVQQREPQSRGPRDRCVEQARLANAWFTGQHQQRRTLATEVPLQESQLVCPPHEGGSGTARSAHVGRRGVGGGQLRAEPAGRLDERAAVVVRQQERLSQQHDGLVSRAVGHPALHVADAPPADGGPLGQFLLREAGGDAVAPQ